MAQAKITSTEAIEFFRARLVLFVTKASCAVNEVLSEINRTRYWLENDQRMHWDREHRKRAKILEQAEQELMSAKISGLRQTTSMQQAAVIKAKRALAEAEEKKRAVKKWNRDFDSAADPMAKKLETLRGYLEHDLPKAVALLDQIQKTLDSYTESSRPGGSASKPEGESESTLLETETESHSAASQRPPTNL
jgi:hypothetical protein